MECDRPWVQVGTLSYDTSPYIHIHHPAADPVAEMMGAASKARTDLIETAAERGCIPGPNWKVDMESVADARVSSDLIVVDHGLYAMWRSALSIQ